MAKLTEREKKILEAMIFKPLEVVPVRKAGTKAKKEVKRVGRRRLPSSVRVSHVDDFTVVRRGKEYNKYKKEEVDWEEYGQLVDLKTGVIRRDYRREKTNGKVNKRFGKKYADHQLWSVKIYKTKNRKHGEFRIIGKAGRIPLTREIGEVYAVMASVGIHVAYVHENGGLCYRGAPLELGTEVESLESMQARYHKGYARATSSVEHWIREKYIAKYGPTIGNRLADKEVKRALAKPRANADNEWGYGLKRKEKAPVKSGSEYVLNLGFKYEVNKKSAGKKERIKPVFLEADREKRKQTLEIENLFPVKDVGGGGGHHRVGTESIVVKSVHKPKQRMAIEDNIRAFVEHQMTIDETQANAMAAQRRFAKQLRAKRGTLKK